MDGNPIIATFLTHVPESVNLAHPPTSDVFLILEYVYIYKIL